MHQMIYFGTDKTFVTKTCQYITKDFCKICIAAILLFDGDERINFLFWQKLYHLKKIRSDKSYCKHLFCRKRKPELILPLRNAGNVEGI